VRCTKVIQPLSGVAAGVIGDNVKAAIIKGFRARGGCYAASMACEACARAFVDE